ncbi:MULTISPECIES: hypothetical protein [Ramlibacter]|uniref:Uncharacterized protein n=1 Tax=Ramlibacter pinisoli TaxID=2682844 RepID=A0A6N8ISF9_9BURK|nr:MULTISPECIES: hypothetical protein [Ramlibacter]MBA2964050.1 hypothetical protein [Ramlibacter sp. CGMCC 1.13660]MVQ29016.1 hypothetical protein [Ramlibacter pinisoli]
MPNQEPSNDGRPRKDAGRPSPDVDTENQSTARGKGASDEQGGAPRADQGDGPGKVGLSSDRQAGLVAPSGVNERDHGAADDKPMGGGSVNFDDDDDDEERPRGNTARTGGTWDAHGGDRGEVGKSPGAGLSDRNGPSDPGRKDDRSPT